MANSRTYTPLSVLLLALHPGSAEAGGLSDAFEREHTVLTAERDALREALRELEGKRQETEKDLATQVTELSERIVELRLQNIALEKEAAQTERAALRAQRAVELDQTLARARSSLQSWGGPLPAADSPVHTESAGMSAIVPLFEVGARMVSRHAGVRWEHGASYFDVDGSERTGDIVWVSRVAAVEPQEQQVLVPVQGDALQAVPRLTATGVASLEGNPNEPVGLFLFDPRASLDPHRLVPRSAWDTFLAGGVVMWPILFLGLMGLVLMLERITSLAAAQGRGTRLCAEVERACQQNDFERAEALCQDARGTLAKVLRTILAHRTLSRSQLEDRASEAILSERPRLERGVSLLNVVAAVAPLLGLLGTVTGMIGTFMVITEHGTGDPQMLSGGISEALLTTQLGLAVAIPALVVHALLARWVERLLTDAETHALHLLNTLETGVPAHEAVNEPTARPDLAPKSSSVDSTSLVESADAR